MMLQEIFKNHIKHSVSWGFIMAILYNAELESPTWKLRKFHMKNAGIQRRAGSRSGPPPVETEDKWVVQEMVFASRKPGER